MIIVLLTGRQLFYIEELRAMMMMLSCSVMKNARRGTMMILFSSLLMKNASTFCTVQLGQLRVRVIQAGDDASSLMRTHHWWATNTNTFREVYYLGIFLAMELALKAVRSSLLLHANHSVNTFSEMFQQNECNSGQSSKQRYKQTMQKNFQEKCDKCDAVNTSLKSKGKTYGKTKII